MARAKRSTIMLRGACDFWSGASDNKLFSRCCLRIQDDRYNVVPKDSFVMWRRKRETNQKAKSNSSQFPLVLVGGWGVRFALAWGLGGGKREQQLVRTTCRLDVQYVLLGSIISVICKRQKPAVLTVVFRSTDFHGNTKRAVTFIVTVNNVGHS